jgi:hypothetical protein
MPILLTWVCFVYTKIEIVKGGVLALVILSFFQGVSSRRAKPVPTLWRIKLRFLADYAITHPSVRAKLDYYEHFTHHGTKFS